MRALFFVEVVVKFIIGLAFVGFMGVSVYLLLNEKKTGKKPQVTTAKIKPKNVAPYMLQRERIGNISIFTFESNETGVKYKMNEEQLDDFANEVKALKEAQPAEIK